MTDNDRNPKAAPEPPESEPRAGEEPPSPPSADAIADFLEAARRHASDGPDEGHQCVGWCPLCRAADVWRAGAPPDVQAAWEEVGHEAMLTLRAVLDHYIRRHQNGGGEPRVEDIPIR